MRIITKCIQCNRPKNIAIVSVRHMQKSAVFLNEKKDNFGKKKILEQIKEHKEKSSSLKEGLTKNYILDVLRNPPSEPVPVDFKLVYKFPLVRYFALINRLKLYHTISSVVASTAVSGLYLSGIVPEDAFNTTFLIGEYSYLRPACRMRMIIYTFFLLQLLLVVYSFTV